MNMNVVSSALEHVRIEQNWSSTLEAYGQQVRRPKYNIRPSVLSASNASDAAKILRAILPGLTHSEHGALSRLHSDMADMCESSWSVIVNEASLETFGRPYQFSDYRVCAIARDEYSPERKEQLRTLAYSRTKHLAAAGAHAKLAAGRMKLN
jgi:hypothetical protein